MPSSATQSAQDITSARSNPVSHRHSIQQTPARCLIHARFFCLQLRIVSIALLTVLSAVTLANAATISGTVRLSGPQPPRPIVNFTGKDGTLSDCHSLHESELLDENLVVSKGGGVSSVFVYIRKGLRRRRYPVPKESRELNQVGCMFRPRVQGIMTGQTLLLKNSDPLLHNVRAISFRNRPFNVGQPANSPIRPRTFRRREKAITIQCDLHPWMVAHLFVMDHPYFAVTDEAGQFRIPNAPAGEYTLSAWHEELGELDSEVTVADTTSPEVEFVFDPPKKKQNVMVGKLSATSPGAQSTADPPVSTSRPFVRRWQPADLSVSEQDLNQYSAERGSAVFQSAGCIKCHVMAGKGTKLGPELTDVTKRFKGQKLLEQILVPSQEINKDFQTQLFLTKAGKTAAGLVIKEDSDEIRLLADPLKPDDITVLKTSEIEERRTSTVSTMPESLLDTFQERDILDLLQFLHVGGLSSD